MILNYFMELYSKDLYPKFLLSELQQPYTSKDVKSALDEKGPFKTPRPDGLQATFFQKNWHVVHKSVCTFVLDVLNLGKSLVEANKTYIALIPKVDNP